MLFLSFVLFCFLTFLKRYIYHLPSPFSLSLFESVDVESEKAEDEEDNDSIVEEKKDDSDEEMERESGDEAVSDSGERSQSEKDEPGASMKEFLLDRAGIGGSESVPGSPSSQVSQGYVKGSFETNFKV